MIFLREHRRVKCWSWDDSYRPVHPNLSIYKWDQFEKGGEKPNLLAQLKVLPKFLKMISIRIYNLNSYIKKRTNIIINSENRQIDAIKLRANDH